MSAASPAPTPLTIIGDPDAASCDGEVCELPEHREQSIINRAESPALLSRSKAMVTEAVS